MTHYLLFMIGIADGIVEVLGTTVRPDEVWMLQTGRNLVDTEIGALPGRRYLIGADLIPVEDSGIIRRRPRLGGMLNFYYRKAA